MKLMRFVLPVLLAVALAAYAGQGLLNRGDYRIQPGDRIDPPSAYTGERPNLVGAMFFSAWCGSCKILEPRLQKILPEFEGRAVEFAKFDFTMGADEEQAAKASELGVEKVYLDNKGSTGFMALIDRRSDRMLVALTPRMTDAQIRAAINAAIKQVSAPVDAGGA